jgi:hypothetical protein
MKSLEIHVNYKEIFRGSLMEGSIMYDHISLWSYTALFTVRGSKLGVKNVICFSNINFSHTTG